MSNVHQISDRTAEEAMDEAAKRIRQCREIAAACKRLAASPLAGRVVNVSLVPQLEALFPEYKTRYFASDGNRKHKGVYLITDRENGTRESRYIPLGDIEQKRISKERLLEYAEEKAKEASQYEAALERFPAALAQYNNIVPYVQDLRNQLMTLMLLTRYSYRDF